MKALLFYVPFWVLGTILSSIVFVSYTAYSILRGMAMLGEGDPQLAAGQISKEVLSWLFVVITISIIGYPLYNFLENRSRFAGLSCFLVLSIVAHFSYQFTQEYFIESGLVLGSLAGVAVFVFVGISIPKFYVRHKQKKLAYKKETEIFD